MKLNQFFSHWDQVHKDTLEVIDRFRQEDLNHVALEGGWTVGEIALHIANAELGWFGTIARKASAEWPSNHTLANYPLKEDIKNLLTDTHASTMDYLETLTLKDLDHVVDSQWGKFSIRFIIWHVMEHEIHHRGELSLILGTLGHEGLDV